MRQLAGKTVLVTGGGQGIGRETALRFAREGAHLVVVDLKTDHLAQVADDVRAHGGQAWSYQLDVTDHDGVLALRDRVRDEVGPIDVLVNNAGTVFGGSFLDVPLRKHLLTYEINTLGLVAVTHAFLPQMITRPRAHLVNICSASAFVGLPFGSTYASSKWAVMGFSESVRLELESLGHRHVHVTTVCPSYVNTGLFNGAKPPRTTQMLDPPRLADQIVRAVLRDKPFLLTPSVVHTTPFLRGILPTRLFDAVGRWFGVTTTMQQWRGHLPAPASAGITGSPTQVHETRRPLGESVEQRSSSA